MKNPARSSFPRTPTRRKNDLLFSTLSVSIGIILASVHFSRFHHGVDVLKRRAGRDVVSVLDDETPERGQHFDNPAGRVPPPGRRARTDEHRGGVSGHHDPSAPHPGAPP